MAAGKLPPGNGRFRSLPNDQLQQASRKAAHIIAM
jgi:hypothetical protein